MATSIPRSKISKPRRVSFMIPLEVDGSGNKGGRGNNAGVSNVNGNVAMYDIDCPPSMTAQVVPDERHHSIDQDKEMASTINGFTSDDDSFGKSHSMMVSGKSTCMRWLCRILGLCVVGAGVGCLMFLVVSKAGTGWFGGKGSASSSTGDATSSSEDGGPKSGAGVPSSRAKYFNTLLGIIETESLVISSHGALAEPSSPQDAALQWLAFEDDVIFEDDVDFLLERYALVVFYHSTGGPSLWDQDGDFLKSTKSHCAWRGIACRNDGNDRVTEISLAQGSLRGTLPPEIYFLQHLEYLEASYNRIEGTIPEELYRLSSLQVLAIAGNSFIGTVSPAIAQLSQLRGFYAPDTFLSGEFPFQSLSTMSALEYFSISTNAFRGEMNDVQFAPDSNITFIDMSGNREIRGSIPTEIGTWGSNLRYLDVFHSGITGTVPSELGLLQNLRDLRLQSNTELHGTIPEELYDCTNMKGLVFGNTNISGTLSTSIGRLKGLDVLALHSTFISGPVPSQIGKLKKLVILSLFDTNMKGELPSQMRKLTNLENLLIHRTQLSGSIPTELCSADHYINFRVGCDNLVRCECCGRCSA